MLSQPNILMSPETNESSQPTPEEIAVFAFLIWEKEGRPSGQLRKHWLQAEIQLLACRAHDKWTSKRNPHPGA